jgi:hypothetical protein
MEVQLAGVAVGSGTIAFGASTPVLISRAIAGSLPSRQYFSSAGATGPSRPKIRTLLGLLAIVLSPSEPSWRCHRL